MDPNNSGIILEDELNESDFTAVSSIGMDMKQIVEKIQKLEVIAMKNSKDGSNGDQSGMMQIVWQMGEKFGKLKKENEGLKDGMVKMIKAFEELKEEFGKLAEENGELKDGMTKIKEKFDGLKEENSEIREMKKEIDGLKVVEAEKNRMFEELNEKIVKLDQENGKLKDENAEKSQEMGEMKKQIEGLKAAKQEENIAIGEFKEEFGRKLREIAELTAQIGSNNAEIEDKIIEKGHKIEELKAENVGLKEAMTKLKDGIDGKNAELGAQIAGLKEEEEKLKEKMAELQGKIEELPKLTEQIGGIEWAKYDWKAFKLDAMKCGEKLTISEGGFVAKRSGPYGWNSVLAISPLPAFNLSVIHKSTIAFYFEMQILKHIWDYGIGIGFCDHQFPLEDKCLGNGNNSIGIWYKGGMWIDGSYFEFGNAKEYFKNGDMIGLGIIHKSNSKLECFATWNGQLLGKVQLPSKFANIQLYPAVNLYDAGDSIRVNFDKENCKFKEFGRVLQLQ